LFAEKPEVKKPRDAVPLILLFPTSQTLTCTQCTLQDFELGSAAKRKDFYAKKKNSNISLLYVRLETGSNKICSGVPEPHKIDIMKLAYF
jgi:hypothetical protein